MSACVPRTVLCVGTMSLLSVTALSALAMPAAGAARSHTALRARALHKAASKKGAPYRWGGTGPYSFDCSGLVKWAYAKAGKRLPRTAAGQYAATRHVAPSHRRRGDLVFFRSGHGVYHVGIYVGHGAVLHAPHTGSQVQVTPLWTHRVTYGRVK